MKTLSLIFLGALVLLPPLAQGQERDGKDYYSITIEKALPQDGELDGFSISAALSPNGKIAAVSTHTGFVYQFYVESGIQIKKLEVGSVFKMEFSSDGQYLVMAGQDSLPRIWKMDMQTGDLHTFQSQAVSSLEPIMAMSVSPKIGRSDGRDSATFVAVGIENRIYVWSLKGKLLKILSGHKKTVSALDFHPDGTQLVSGGADKKLMVWNWNSSKIVAQKAKAHKNRIKAVKYSPLPLIHIVSGGKDGYVHLWDTTLTGPLEPGKLQHMRRNSQSVEALAIYPKPFFLVSGGQDQAFRTWESADLPAYINNKVLAIQPDRQEVRGVPLDLGFDQLGNRMISTNYRKKVFIWQVIKRLTATQPEEASIEWITETALQKIDQNNPAFTLKAKINSDLAIEMIALRINDHEWDVTPNFKITDATWEKTFSTNWLQAGKNTAQLYVKNSVGTALSKPITLELGNFQ